ncbi:hypothetical protein B9Z55_009077 [Caenorhabditis nigoni]|uniref:Uncharacterized protein n=1 Tax=Caenorhabditis nigoni TaxID=1611254 RepID=A0A2G5UQH2_9PELO|nr:hypothetical protein B9Z55_009077 [Caenorhabditis nigoni]
MKKNDSNVVTKIWIDRIQKADKDGQNLAPHSIASMPFCNKPRFIHELSNVDIKKTVLQATILDVKLKVYSGESVAYTISAVFVMNNYQVFNVHQMRQVAEKIAVPVSEIQNFLQFGNEYYRRYMAYKVAVAVVAQEDEHVYFKFFIQ